MFLKSAAPFAVALAVLAASPAAVQAAGFEQHSQKVYFGDLNLASDDGQAALKSRIEFAAGEVCGGNEVHRGLGENITYKACRADTVSDGLAAVHKASVNIQTVALNLK
jgi:UrcA family protein